MYRTGFHSFTENDELKRKYFFMHFYIKYLRLLNGHYFTGFFSNNNFFNF